MKSSFDFEIVDKVDVEDIIQNFRILSIDSLASYLKEVWKDLALRSDDKSKGINKVTFSKYYELPGIINDRLFSVFDVNRNEYLDSLEFIEGMKVLYTESFDSLVSFIFNFYDFDKDGKISKEDVSVVLSYIPLNTKSLSKLQLKFENHNYIDRVESQNEIHKILEKSFKSDKLDENEFRNVVENVCSEMFLFTLIFLLEKRPFSKKSIKEFEAEKYKKLGNSNFKTPSVKPNRLIASPNLMSKFTPSLTISKSPAMKKRMHNMGNKNPLLRYATFKENPVDPRNILMKYSGGGNKNSMDEDNTDENVTAKNVPMVRKNRNNLRKLETSRELNVGKWVEDDFPLIPAVRRDLDNNQKLNIIKDEVEDVDSDDEERSEVRFESYLYKLTHSKKLKKLYFRLFFKDIYYYKNKDEPIHKGMHNLSGVFIKEEHKCFMEGMNLFCFSVIYPKKTRMYYTDNESDYKYWIYNIQKATGYSNLTDIYEIKEKLGNGKFGLVRLGIHKETNRKVAIKIMSKREMTVQDLELVKTEIEILKICQQPNIIQLYDVFENVDFIYIIMEFCSGSDLFSYIEKRGFSLPEPQSAKFINKLSTAIYYIHSYGVAHRDLKPENILMTDSSDDADIRLLDFGLSKILGPTETCIEPFGTLSYVAPEVLCEKPYDKRSDLWSLGIITYLLLCGCLPFDDEHSEREIARQTIHEPTPFPNSIWKNLSQEAKSFVDSLLQKDPNKRMSIVDVIEHPWLHKYNLKISKMKKESKDFGGCKFDLYSSLDQSKI